MRNANFAFSSPLYMGHKNFQESLPSVKLSIMAIMKSSSGSANLPACTEDVNTFADWYSWMNLGFAEARLDQVFLGCTAVGM